MSKVRELVEAGMKARLQGWRLKDARRAFEAAHAAAGDGASLGDRIAALKGMAQIERDDGNTALAAPYLEQATTLCRQQEDGLLLAHTIRHLADVRQDLGELADAEPLYREALDLYRVGRPGPLDFANALRPTAILMEKLGRPAEALAFAEEAETLYAQARVEAGVADARKLVKRLRDPG